MITSQKINVWMQDPTHLQDVEAKKIKQLVKEFPYCSIGQLFYAIKTKENVSHVANLFNINPVKSSILYAKAEDNYKPIRIQGNIEAEILEEEIVTNATATDSAAAMDQDLDSIIQQNLPIPDYFSKEAIAEVAEVQNVQEEQPNTNEENAVLVVMSYTEWLKFLSKKSQQQKEEAESKSALRALWQKEKLAQALEEETDEIPEDVFEMAVNSISKNEEIASESLAEVYIRQNKKEQAINMYKKLSLLYPEKNTYFAMKIENLQKEL